MASRTTTIIGNTREEKLAALDQARKKRFTIWYEGLHDVPFGTHLFSIAENNIFGLKEVNSKTKGLLNLPIVAGVITVSGTGKKIVFGLENTPETNNLFMPEQFHHLIKEGQKVYLTIGKNANGWSEVTNVQLA